MSLIFKNQAGQKARVFAFATSDHATLTAGAPVTGDAANITAVTAVDDAALSATNDVNPTEVDATNAKGWYEFDLTQAETNGDILELYPQSSTTGVEVRVAGGSVQRTKQDETDFTASDRAKLDELHDNRLTAARAGNLDNLNAPVANIPTNPLLDTTDGSGFTAIPLHSDLQDGGRLDMILDELTVQGDTNEGKLDTLLSRITSTLFSGITSLAQWLGLIAARHSGDATARAELNATGAGLGTYDETDHSLQAIRDTGDNQWQTAVGFSTHSAADVWAAAGRTLTAATNITSNGAAIELHTDNKVIIAGTTHTGAVIPTISVLTGHTPQSGDSFVRIGAPSGASISSDIASVKSDTSGILTNTVRVDGLIEDDGSGNDRFTAKALEQAPSGGAGGVVGAGSEEVVVDVIEQGSGDPLDGVAVWITTDQAGNDVVAGTLFTDAMGKVTFMLDPGTYYAWKQLSGHNFTNPEVFTVT